jgi:hypothetical protein
MALRPLGPLFKVLAQVLPAVVAYIASATLILEPYGLKPDEPQRPKNDELQGPKNDELQGPNSSQEAKSDAELQGVRWLFFIVLGVAVTNGTRTFWTGEVTNSNLKLTNTDLHSWFTLYGTWNTVYYLVFVVQIIMTTLSGVFLLQTLYGSSNGQGWTRALGLIFDAFVVVAIGILFNGISFTLDNPQDGSLRYVILFAFIFGLQLFWFALLAVGVLWRRTRKKGQRASQVRTLAPKLAQQVAVVAAPLLLLIIGFFLLSDGVLPSADYLLVPIVIDAFLAAWRLSTRQS